VTEPRILLTDLILVESPRWHDDRLWFCDWVAHEVIAADLDGGREVVRHVASFPFSIDWLPDSTLIVAESFRQRLTAFDIEPYGDLTNRRVWAHIDGGAPNGICLDAEGAVWFADVPNRRCMRVREGGEVLQTVDVDRGCFACMLGGPDGSTLFILAAIWGGPDAVGEQRSGQLLARPAPAPHAGRP
jgi:sugar lactone lactonase YvrE